MCYITNARASQKLRQRPCYLISNMIVAHGTALVLSWLFGTFGISLGHTARHTVWGYGQLLGTLLGWVLGASLSTRDCLAHCWGYRWLLGRALLLGTLLGLQVAAWQSSVAWHIVGDAGGCLAELCWLAHGLGYRWLLGRVPLLCTWFGLQVATRHIGAGGVPGCRELVDHPSLVSQRSVLELGSGCGLCGVVAAKLGASDVS
jgi:Lysine methyltransferase